MYHAYPLACVSQCGLYIYFLVHYSTMLCHVTEANIHADTHACMYVHVITTSSSFSVRQYTYVTMCLLVLVRHVQRIVACLCDSAFTNCGSSKQGLR